VPTAEPEFGIVSFAPTDSTLGVVAGLFAEVNVPTVMLTPPAAMVTDDPGVAVYEQPTLLHPTLNLATLPTFLLDRTIPAEAVRAPAALMVIVQLLHVGKTTKVPKSSVWVELTVVALAAPCAA
jgi:hypothetical protein